MMFKTFRKPTQKEKEILAKLFQKDFPEKDILLEQLSSALVREISEYPDNWGSIEFDVKSEKRASLLNRIPVQGIVYDSDNIPVEIFLHVIDGRTNELEIVKVNGTPLKTQIDPEKIQVKTYQEIAHE